MIIHKEATFSIYFGDAKSCKAHHRSPEFTVFCSSLCDKFKLDSIVFQHQVHGTDGLYLDQTTSPTDRIVIYKNEGDLLITNLDAVGIGVLTADCLPIVVYDTANRVAAVAHAGWRGSVAGIAVKTIERMLARKLSKPGDLRIFFGPSAKSCCYEVQPDFLPNIEKFIYKNEVIIKRDNKLFCDVPLLNKRQLIDLGIAPDQINLDYNLCTLCNHNFHSSRRHGPGYSAQSTVVWLK
jgi:YfiH family protein